MRWTIRVCRRHGHIDCPAGGCLHDYDRIEVVPASFTDEDVERVALAISVQFAAWPLRSRGITRYTLSPDGAEELARAALSAYLEPTTKGDT